MAQALNRLAGRPVSLLLDSPLSEVLGEGFGWPTADSLEALELALALEEEYGVWSGSVASGSEALAAVVLKVLLGRRAAAVCDWGSETVWVRSPRRLINLRVAAEGGCTCR